MKLSEQDEKDFETLLHGCPDRECARRHIEALSRLRSRMEEVKGHARNCVCHIDSCSDHCDTVREFDFILKRHKHSHPYADPRCSPAPPTQPDPEKVKAAHEAVSNLWQVCSICGGTGKKKP